MLQGVGTLYCINQHDQPVLVSAHIQTFSANNLLPLQGQKKIPAQLNPADVEFVFILQLTGYPLIPTEDV